MTKAKMVPSKLNDKGIMHFKTSLFMSEKIIFVSGDCLIIMPISTIIYYYALLTNCSKSQVLGDLYGRLSIVLVRANARAILARSLQVTDMQVDAMDY